MGWRSSAALAASLHRGHLDHLLAFQERLERFSRAAGTHRRQAASRMVPPRAA
jgi:hypothetical protein